MSEEVMSAIEDSITDIELQPLGDEISEPEGSTTTPEEIVAPEASNEPTEASSETPEVSSPAKSEQDTKTQDEFDKKHGLQALSTSGRENRIPYSRVKKISEKAAKDAVDARNKEIESTYVPAAKYQEYEAKVKDYEGRLGQVADFERVMMGDAPRFLDMLSSLPPYQEFFRHVAQLYQQVNGQQQPSQQPAPAEDSMPQPDQDLTDGSKVYSLDGLKALLSWNAKQVEDRVTQQVTNRYKPLEDSYKSYQQVQSVLPVVQQQIAEARQWPLFNESESEIVKALQTNPNWSLERAYQHVIIPKMQANRNALRSEVLKEVKQAPRATSAPATATKAPVARASSGPRNLEDVIAEQVAMLKG